MEDKVYYEKVLIMLNATIKSIPKYPAPIRFQLTNEMRLMKEKTEEKIDALSHS